MDRKNIIWIAFQKKKENFKEIEFFDACKKAGVKTPTFYRHTNINVSEIALKYIVFYSDALGIEIGDFAKQPMSKIGKKTKTI